MEFNTVNSIPIEIKLPLKNPYAHVKSTQQFNTRENPYESF